MFISEAVAAVAEAKIKAADMAAAVQVCMFVSLHHLSKAVAE